MGDQRIATRTLYYNADKSALVEEGSPEAAFLFARAGSPVDPAEAARLKFAEHEARAAYDAQADHAAKHGGDTEAAAQGKRAKMFQGVPDPDGPPAEGERAGLEDDEKAASGAESKAVSKAPANKSK